MSKNDLRVKKTLASIHSAFHELIYENDYEKITLKKLTEKAGIHKKTFYRYYSSLDDLLVEFQKNISDDFIKKVSSFNIPEDLNKINKEFFIFSKTYGKFYDKLTINPKYDYIRQKMIDNVMNATWNKSDIIKKMNLSKRKMLLSFVQVSSLDIYKNWIEEKRKIPLDEIIEILTAIMKNAIEILRL